MLIRGGVGRGRRREEREKKSKENATFLRLRHHRTTMLQTIRSKHSIHVGGHAVRSSLIIQKEEW